MAIYQATADDRNALTLIFFIQKNYWKLIAQEILTKAPTYGKYFLTDHAKNNTPQQTLEKPYLKTQAFIFSRQIVLLTVKQAGLLCGLVLNQTPAQLADYFSCSKRSVEEVMARIRVKLKAANTQKLLSLAISNRFLKQANRHQELQDFIHEIRSKKRE